MLISVICILISCPFQHHYSYFGLYWCTFHPRPSPPERSRYDYKRFINSNQLGIPSILFLQAVKLTNEFVILQKCPLFCYSAALLLLQGPTLFVCICGKAYLRQSKPPPLIHFMLLHIMKDVHTFRSPFPWKS